MTSAERPETLLDRIKAFTDPRSIPSDPDDPSSTPQTIPSLWEQLLDPTRTGQGGSRAPRSALPGPVDVMSLTAFVERCCLAEIRSRRGSLRYRPDGERDIPAELLAIHALVISADPAAVEVWNRRLDRWVREARLALGIDRSRLGLPRGTRCVDCGAQYVEDENEEGERVKAPALRLVWTTTAAGTPVVRYVHCRACNAARYPEDLHMIAEEQIRLQNRAS